MKVCRIGLIVLFVALLMNVATAGALEQDLADEFAALSRQTRQAMDLSPVELEALVERCNLLKEQIENLQTREKKIMGKRVRRLCGLFLYVLDSKQGTEKKTATD